MRPDEHKRKKSNLYKKKHGIQTDKAASGKAEEDNKTRGAKKDQSGASSSVSSSRSQVQRPASDVSRPPARSLQSSSDSEEDDEQSTGVEYERKLFRRRQITSNWARYDLPTAEEEGAQAAASRGESFTKLLSQAGGADSLLKLQDEQNWEMGAGEAGARPPCLALDLTDLADCLLCLPLHQRLGLSSSLFSEEQIREMEQNAESSAVSYVKSTKQTGSSVALLEGAGEVADSTESDASSKASSTSVASLKHRDLSLTNVLKQQNKGAGSGHRASAKTAPGTVADVKDLAMPSTGLAQLSPSSSASSAPSESSVRIGAELPGSATLDAASAVSAELEDELDELLALDTPLAQPKPASSQPLEGARQDALPSSNKTQQLQMSVEASKAIPDAVSKTSSSTTGQGDNLEDWLDSILDD